LNCLNYRRVSRKNKDIVGAGNGYRTSFDGNTILCSAKKTYNPLILLLLLLPVMETNNHKTVESEAENRNIRKKIIADCIVNGYLPIGRLVRSGQGGQIS